MNIKGKTKIRPIVTYLSLISITPVMNDYYKMFLFIISLPMLIVEIIADTENAQVLNYLKRRKKYQGPPKTGSIWIPAMLKTGARDLVSNRQICPKRYDNDGLA